MQFIVLTHPQITVIYIRSFPPSLARLCPRAAAFAEARHRASELQRGGATTAGTQTETLAKLKLG